MEKLGLEQQKALLSCIGGLGQSVRVQAEDGSVIRAYKKKPQALEFIRELQALLRADARRTGAWHLQLSEWETLENHLLPLLATYRECEDLVFETIKLMVALTMPADAETRDWRGRARCLQRYKDAFLRQDVIAILVSMLSGSFVRVREEGVGTELMDCILLLLRNLLAVPDVPESASSSGAHMYVLQSEFVVALDRENFLEFVALLGNKIEERSTKRFVRALLELVYLLFRGEDPNELARFAVDTEKCVERRQLKGESLSRALEVEMKKSRSVKSTRFGVRHSRFGGTFAAVLGTGVSAVEEKKSYFSLQKLVSRGVDGTGEEERGSRKVTREKVRPRSNADAKMVLGKFARRFLDHCYNPCMRVIESNGDFERRAELDISDIYVWAIGFFQAYHVALHDLTASAIRYNPDAIRSTLNSSVFLFMAGHMDECSQHGRSDSLTLSVQSVGRALRVLIKLIDSERKDHAETIFLRLAYNSSILFDRIARLVSSFSRAKHPLELLASLVETAHALLSLSELMSVRDKKITVSRKKKKTSLDALRLEESGPAPTENEDDSQAASHEKYFDFEHYLSPYARPSIIRSYSHLLRSYLTNRPSTNAAIEYIIRHVVDTLRAPHLFFHTSHLKTFVLVLNDPSSARRAQTPEISAIQRISKRILNMLFYSLRRAPLLIGLSMLRTAKLKDPRLQSVFSAFWSEDRSFDGRSSDSAESPPAPVPVVAAHIDKSEDFSTWLDRLLSESCTEPIDQETAVPKRPAEPRQWTQDQDRQILSLFEEFAQTVLEGDESLNIFEVIVSMADDIPHLSPVDVYSRLIELGVSQVKSMPRPVSSEDALVGNSEIG
ncbi:protein timeless homolog [Schistocerca gregaria]|uniref:protein timeless homolog n=1 Tax=Schistocerca gregaria TaxID=7010 RepID=UPI00211E7204|nr:protein timeless homolog [Schistocerca gregaria]